MNTPAIFTDRKARENFKDKFEVVMAVIVLGSFLYKKSKQAKESSDSEVPVIITLPEKS